MTSFSQYTARVEIEITMQKIGRIYVRKLLLFFMRIAVLIVIIMFNPCVAFEKMMSFSPIFIQDLKQGKLIATVNINSRK